MRSLPSPKTPSRQFNGRGIAVFASSLSFPVIWLDQFLRVFPGQFSAQPARGPLRAAAVGLGPVFDPGAVRLRLPSRARPAGRTRRAGGGTPRSDRGPFPVRPLPCGQAPVGQRPATRLPATRLPASRLPASRLPASRPSATQLSGTQLSGTQFQPNRRMDE